MKDIVYFASLGWLYLVQGIPYGLQDKFIPIQLRSHGLQYSQVSLLKVLLIPWVGKGLWAPVVEVWGGLRCWLLASLLALAASSYAGSVIVPEDVFSIGCVLLALNISCAVQDIVVDGLTLQVLPDSYLGLGNTIQVVLYKVGSLVGGAGLTYILTKTDWATTFLILTGIYLCTAVWTILSPAGMKPSYFKSHTSENTARPKITNKIKGSIAEENFQFGNKNDSRLGKVFIILKEVFSTPGTMWLSIYVMIYKMGERGAINNMPLFLFDAGLSKSQLAFWNGTVCQVLSIIGSFHGGIMLTSANVNIKPILLTHSMYRILAVLSQLIYIILWEQYKSTLIANPSLFYTLSITSLCFLSYSSGAISTLSFTLMMRVSRECGREAQTSHYSALASVEIAGKLIFASLAGFVIDLLGMAPAFALFTSLCTLPVFVLAVMPSDLCHLKTE